MAISYYYRTVPASCEHRSLFQDCPRENFVDASVSLITDVELFNTYSLRTPLTFVIFVRLRLSVRLVQFATIDLLALLYAARGDHRSWIKAFEDDLRWLAAVMPGHSYVPQQWLRICRADAKLARRVVRNACASDSARAHSFSQLSQPMRVMVQSFSRPCGKVCRSKQGYVVHQAAMHGMVSLVRWYAHNDGLCELAASSSRRGNFCVINHLRSGSPLCLLSLLLHVPHFTDAEEKVHTEAALEVSRINRKSDIKAGAASRPAFRRPWVPWRFFDLDGQPVPLHDKRHPCRCSRVQYGWMEN